MLLDHHVGLLEGIIHVADLQRPEEGRVGPKVLMDQRRALFDGLLHVGDHVEWLVIHVYVFQGILRRVAVARHDHRHRVTHMVNLVLGDGPVVGHLEVFGYLPAAGDRDRPLVRQVLAGERRYHTGLLEGRRDVDVRDLRVREGAAQQREVQHARQLHVVGIGALSGYEGRILLARYPASHVAFWCLGHSSASLSSPSVQRPAGRP